jgi:hypothetical protein
MIDTKALRTRRMPPPAQFRRISENGLMAPIGRSSLIVAGLLILLCTAARAQLYTGTVTGLITDPSNASVPAAQLRLVDEDKGFKFAAATDATGRYLLRPVPPGTYKLTVDATGFKGQTRSGIVIDVNQNVTVDFSLEMGSTSAAVQVTEAAPLLAAEDAVTGQVMSRKQINDLPLISRSVFQLSYLTPGITEVDTACAPPKCTTGNNFISNGSRNATADILLDGVSTTNFEQNSGAQVPMYTPAMDAVQEFVVQQSNFSAEYGFSGATVINTITRSGSNQFHGSAYDFLRNSALDSNNFFSNRAGRAIPPLKLNDFGATLGGPIQRNKTFFFFDYEGTRQATMSNFSAGVPSVAERQGDFGELCAHSGGTFDSAGRCSADAGQIWDPYSGAYSAVQGGAVRSAYIPFNNMATYMSPGNPKLNGTGFQLPATRGNLIDPVAAKMMGYYPLPNLNVGTGAYDPTYNWIGSTAVHQNVNQFDIKVDRQFGERDLLSAKYSQSSQVTPPWGCFGNEGDPCNKGPKSSNSHLVAINQTHTFSPSVVLSLSYGLTRNVGWFGHGIQAVYPNLSPDKTLGMPAYMGLSGTRALPAIEVDGYASAGGGLGVGTQGWSVLHSGQDVQQLVGSVSWVKGQHQLKFGAEGRWHRQNYTQPGTPAGYFAYDFSGTSEFPESGGGDALATFLTGVGGTNSWGQYEIPNFVSTSSWQIGGFAQDNWKISKELTVNIGLRYDLNLPRTERYNRMNGLDPNIVSPLDVPALGTLHGGEVFMSPSNRTNYNTQAKDFGPRFGFAYRALEKTVIRGGYGIYFSTDKSGAAGTGAIGWQGYDQVTPWVTTYQGDGATPWGRLSSPFPSGPILPIGNKLGALNDVGFDAYGPIPSLNSTTPYEQTWSLGIQRELPSNILVDATYVGKKGTHLYYGGTGNLDVLGPQIEGYSLAQIGALNGYVANPFSGYITNPASALSGPSVKAYQLQLPYPQFTTFNGDVLPVANSIYHALQVKAEKRFSHGFSFLVTYVWSKSIDDASLTSDAIAYLGGHSSLQDPNNFRLERGLSTFDMANVFQVSYTYELPLGRGKAFGGQMNPVLNAIVGGWQTNGIWRFTDGRPMLLTLSGGTRLPTYGAQRPDLTGTLACSTASDFLTHYFANPQVLSVPAPYALGTAPRTDGSCRQPGQANTNLSLFKDFALPKLREGSHLQFRVEAFNALNHTQFAGPNTTFHTGGFGRISSVAVLPREVQVALKLNW